MPHRSENHSRLEDWIKRLPPEGFREMCSWERFCTFARDPEQRKVDSEACVNANGIRYQLDYGMASQEVTLLWGLFDNELFVELNREKHGPFYPTTGPIQLETFRKPKRNATEKRADIIGELAQQISIPRSALSGEERSIATLLQDANILHIEPSLSIPFPDVDPFEQASFKNKIDAKTAIAEFLGHSLAQLSSAQIDEINRIISETLDKKRVMAEVKNYFTIRLKDCLGEDSCTGK